MRQPSCRPPQRISIHALREEGDVLWHRQSVFQCWISIHALREEGDSCATPNIFARPAISIHALREEGDPLVPCLAAWPL